MKNEDIEFDIIKNEETATVKIKGRLDVITSHVFESELEKKQEELNGFEHVIFDIEDLEYISSAGLRLLVRQQKILSSKNIEFEIHNANDYISKVFDMTGFRNIVVVK